MKIDPTTPRGGTPVRRKERASGAGEGAFAEKLGEAGGGGGAGQVAGGTAIGGLDALLTLQEVPDALAGRAKARRQGERMLDLLDDLRLRLLDGRLPESTVERLAEEVARTRETSDDPRLNGILEEIELRAQVELAKLRR